MGKKRSSKYLYVPFVNEARQDGLQLKHWTKADKVNSGAPYLFSKFDKVFLSPLIHLGFTELNFRRSTFRPTLRRNTTRSCTLRSGRRKRRICCSRCAGDSTRG